MRRRWVVACVCAAGCGGAQPAAEAVVTGAVEYCPEAIPEAIPPEPELSQWWVDRATACPEGTAIKGMAPPMQKEVWVREGISSSGAAAPAGSREDQVHSLQVEEAAV